MPHSQNSIRRRLLVSLVGVLASLVLATALLTYLVASHAANDAYDRSLLDPALDVQKNTHVNSGSVRLDLPLKALDALTFDHSDEVIFQVRSPDGTVIAGRDDLPAAKSLNRGQHLFYDTTVDGNDFRVAALLTEENVFVQFGETRQKRSRLVREILVSEFVPTLLFAVATIGIAWAAIAHGLTPLGRVRAEVFGRPPRDLRSIPNDLAPVEIAPVVEAFNRLLDRLRDASAAQQRFLANAAHQLRTPLAGLQMHLELLLRREQDSEVRSSLEWADKAIHRATRVMNQLLLLARVESADAFTLSLQPLDLYVFAQSIAEQWVPSAIARNLDLGFELEHALMVGDARMLRRLLDNLIENALIYTPKDGAVTVKCGYRRGVPYLSVEDTGPGIPSAERVNVFERFYRIAGTQGEGAGLGLAIVKEIARVHGARVAIDTPQNGQGARVVVLFCDSATMRMGHAHAT